MRVCIAGKIARIDNDALLALSGNAEKEGSKNIFFGASTHG